MIYSAASEYLDHFQFLIIAHKAYMNSCVQVFLWKYLFLFGKLLGGEWIMYVVSLYLTKGGLAKLFPKVIALFSISACILFVPHSHQQLNGRSLNVSQSSICGMIPLSFNLSSSRN